MFHMRGVGRKIAERRKERNMTQMELADAMGVSFQAVSNWERGNSMPDIGKLPDLSNLLGISIDEMLTDEKPLELVRHILGGDEKAYVERERVTPDTVAQVAPILKPEQTERILEDVLARNADMVRLADLIPIAPFVSDAFLRGWVAQAVDADNLHDVVALAPFLSEETLDNMADRMAETELGVCQLIPLAPFLSEAALDKLVERAVREVKPGDLVGLAPFLSEAAMDAAVRKIVNTGDVGIGQCMALAPFLSEASLDWLAEQAMDKASPEELTGLAPFLSKKALERCADGLIARYGVKGIKSIAPFL